MAFFYYSLMRSLNDYYSELTSKPVKTDMNEDIYFLVKSLSSISLVESIKEVIISLSIYSINDLT